MENFNELKQNKDEKKSKYHIGKIIMTVILGFLAFIAGISAFFFICINGFSMDGSTAHTTIPAIISVIMKIGFTASILLIWNKFPNIKGFKIDSNKIKKVVREYLPRSFQMINIFDYTYYAIPAEYAEAIANAKKQVSFTFYVPNRKPDTISFSEEKQPEIKNIILNGHFSNYLDDLNKLTEKKPE